MSSLEMEDIIHKFSVLTDKPVKYLTVQNDLQEDIKNLVKSLYDYTKGQENKKGKGALPEIIVKDFDEEQIWQQIELQNAERWDDLVWEVANCMSAKTDLKFPIQIVQPQVSEDHTANSDSEDHIEDSEDHIADSEDDVDTKKSKKSKLKKKKDTSKSKTKTSIVDDQFFKLQDMEKFLLKEEKMEGKVDKKDDSDEESIDMFEDIDDDDDDEEDGEGKDVKYSDFFDGDNEEDYEEENNDANSEEYASEGEDNVEPKKKGKKVRFATQESDDDSDDSNIETNDNTAQNGHTNDEKQSEFELRQQRLKQQISKLEEKTLTEAPWQLKGEVDATKRPQNSLLEEVVDFDLTTRPPPVITEQTTLTLEEIIKRRIKDKAWDDVVKKEKPVDDQLAFKKPEILDQNKSKLSLAQVYEAEYLKQKQALSGGDEEEKEPESHTEIREAMSKLFSKLDALCHYHYTPKAPQAEVKIVSNTPAISMEEVAPVATSDAALLAPEEVKKKQRGDLMSKAERTQTDKNRERRKKKKLQRKKGKVMKVTEHRNTTKGVEVNDKALKTSKAFFQQLNDEATSLIKTKTNRNVKNKGQ
ncbi:U3 small nucleolar ribonucleoprotein protein MPP10 [Epargyreus clarus]|uniref:U3 small nucleolar ribonucleoprotein protein MPP10 n=1 Tax=Epargyreus clarus TaxID=520877 RepID=UPI003C2BAB84